MSLDVSRKDTHHKNNLAQLALASLQAVFQSKARVLAAHFTPSSPIYSKFIFLVFQKKNRKEESIDVTKL